MIERLAEGQNLCFMVVQTYYGVTKRNRCHLSHPSLGFLARLKVMDIDQKYFFLQLNFAIINVKYVWDSPKSFWLAWNEFGLYKSGPLDGSLVFELR